MTAFISPAIRRLWEFSGLRGPRAAARPVPRPGYPVDIILPVYGGLEDTVRCVESVLASPIRTAYRLVIINDASPEPEITSWLRSRCAGDSRILLLENEENLGFVRTVNRGMSLSESHDVLILNSDTEVANDWLDRIRGAAYGDARIASVTPLSTNATICSYPRFCEDNAMPAGYDTARLDALCARIHPGAVVDVPTGVGFCMYMRRDALRNLGLFDTDHFGKGYGEENDFCQRAAAAGWRNVLLLDTFVLHTGGVSFGASRHARQEAGMLALQRLHPHYESEVHRFIGADPARAMRLALDAARIRELGIPVILAVLHGRSGGTMRHVKELAKHLAGKAVFFVLTPMPGKRVLLRMADDSEPFELAFRLPRQFDALLQVLRGIGVRHVHFHHLLGHQRVVRELPSRLGVTHDFTVHDFYSFCTHASLTGKDGRYLGEQAPGQCRCCAPQKAAPRDGSGTVADWRGANASLLRGARHVFAPSHDAASRILGLAPDARVVVVPHPDLLEPAKLARPAPSAVPPAANLKVVVLGALSVMKGADVLEATAVEAARRAAPVEFHLLGHGYRPLKTWPAAQLTVHGEYKESDLPRLLSELQPHLVWFPAQTPETYSYTMSAALAAGLPVIATDLGAFAERVRGRAWSWIRPWNMTPADWLGEFVLLRERHFVAARPPSLQDTQGHKIDAPAAGTDAWSYGGGYLAGLPAGPAPGPLLVAADLAPYQHTSALTPRLRLLAVLTYLRFHPLMRGIVFSIPAPWRQRVNDWLSA